MRKSGYITILVVILLLTGCGTNGIHLFTVQLVGEVRESSMINQPLKGVEIFTSDGKKLGVTDAGGKFAVNVTVRRGVIELTFKYPDYYEESFQYSIKGGSTEIVQLPPMYLTSEGGQVSGRLSRQIPELAVNQAQQLLIKDSFEKDVDRIEGEYNLVTRKGRDWLEERLGSRGSIISEVQGSDLYTVRFDSALQGEQFISELNLGSDVEYIEPNRRVYLQGLVPEDEYLPVLWNMEMIDAVEAWGVSTGLGVKVAVLDSLYRSSHPDLAYNLMSGLEVHGRTETDLYLSVHGTHVAGIIGAIANQDGVIGVAPRVRIQPIRVFKWNGFKPDATVADVVKGINMAIDAGVQVINMSFGMNAYDQSIHDAVKRAYAAGIVLVAASGNNGSNVILYPAALPEVIAVGAVGPDEVRTQYSQAGPGIELMAPGGNARQGREAQILSTVWKNSGYSWDYEEGTSMAAPHVSGLVALLMSYGISDPDYIRLLLRQTAKDLGPMGYDQETGYGLINAARVLALFKHCYVFFGSVEEGYAQVKSPVYKVDVNGDYALSGARPGAGRVVGWIDINNNLKIDAGDYLGQSALVEVSGSDAVISGVDLTLEMVAGNFSAIEVGTLR